MTDSPLFPKREGIFIERRIPMSISRNNRTYYTKEEYEAAKRNDNALFYAQRQGYDLVRTGRYFYMRQHDSLVFAPSGAWFWNSRGLSGRALEFIVLYEGRSFPEAVLILAGAAQPGFTPRVIPRSIPPPVKQPQPIPFVLPKPADNNRQLFAYLCGRRKLEEAIVQEMLEQKVLYESVSPNHIHNACFVSYDETGKPCSAFLRGMGEKPFKGEVPGGSKNHGWLLHGKQPDTLLVFEAAIDAASYASFLLHQGIDPFQGRDYLALGGLCFDPIANYLAAHPHIRKIDLLLDGDSWGRAAAARFKSDLQEKGFHVSTQFPPVGKDWNDTLISSCGTEQFQTDTVI